MEPFSTERTYHVAKVAAAIHLYLGLPKAAVQDLIEAGQLMPAREMMLAIAACVANKTGHRMLVTGTDGTKGFVAGVTAETPSRLDHNGMLELLYAGVEQVEFLKRHSGVPLPPSEPTAN